jgi:hypothetical protein
MRFRVLAVTAGLMVVIGMACGTESHPRSDPDPTVEEPEVTAAPLTVPPTTNPCPVGFGCPPPGQTVPTTANPCPFFSCVPATRAPNPQPTVNVPGGCNPNYTPCVPNDSVDVDCAGGSGDGPSYVSGPVRVTGTDVYDLDRNGDRIGCES